jgi:hypothetical protein
MVSRRLQSPIPNHQSSILNRQLEAFLAQYPDRRAARGLTARQVWRLGRTEVRPYVPRRRGPSGIFPGYTIDARNRPGFMSRV